MCLIGLCLTLRRSEQLLVAEEVSHKHVSTIAFMDLVFVEQGERGRRARPKPCQRGVPGSPGLRGDNVRVPHTTHTPRECPLSLWTQYQQRQRNKKDTILF